MTSQRGVHRGVQLADVGGVLAHHRSRDLPEGGPGTGR